MMGARGNESCMRRPARRRGGKGSHCTSRQAGRRAAHHHIPDISIAREGWFILPLQMRRPRAAVRAEQRGLSSFCNSSQGGVGRSSAGTRLQHFADL